MFTTIMELLIGVPLAYILFMHLLGPALVLRTERQPGTFVFVLIDEREFFSRRSDTFIVLDCEMRNLGFRYVGSSVLANTNSSSFFSLYTKDDEQLSAMLTTIESPLGDFTYAEFSQRYADGAALEINNAPISPLFPRYEKRLQLRYPQVNSLRGLYEVMVRLIKAHPIGSVAVPLPAGREFRQTEALLNEELERLVRGGYYSRDVVDGFRPITLKGAIRFSWKSLWPWQAIRQRYDLYCSNKILQRS